MKRFVRVNAAACAAIAAFWGAIIVADAKAQDSALLNHVYRVSLLMWIAGLPILNAAAFRKAADKTRWRAAVAGVIVALLFAYLGLISMIELKVALGGHK